MLVRKTAAGGAAGLVLLQWSGYKGTEDNIDAPVSFVSTKKYQRDCRTTLCLLSCAARILCITFVERIYALKLIKCA